jgi:predicted ATP-grasp superfamily ATP-dependent carboligase
MARSINKLPVRVYKNNKNAALTLADDAPQIPTIKNKGINTLSKKI